MTDIRRPVSGNWIFKGSPHFGEIYDSLTGLRVVSSIDHPDGHPEWHISVSALGVRPSLEAALAALADFNASDFEEDNHVSGKARHYWLAVDPAHRRVCPCKDKEAPIVEGDFTWRKEGGA